MSIKIMSRVWESGPEKQADRFVLLAIADYANDEGECWPSIAGICRKTCMSERGVQTIIRRLEAEGWLHIETGKGRRNCNLYTVKTPHKVHPAQDAPPHMNAETPHMDAINPAPRAPEPSYNHQEPSLFGGDAPKPKKRRPEIDIPDGWVPSDRNIQDAIDKGLSEREIQHEADRFRDHHQSKQSRFRDWDAAWRKWCGNAVKFKSSRPAHGRGMARGTTAAEIADFGARWAESRAQRGGTAGDT